VGGKGWRERETKRVRNRRVAEFLDTAPHFFEIQGSPVIYVPQSKEEVELRLEVLGCAQVSKETYVYGERGLLRLAS